MVSLIVILVISVFGITALSMARGDVLQSGSTLDIKSAEEASLAGINHVLGSMTANPANSVAQLQKFVDDTGTTSPRQWFQMEGDSFQVVSSPPVPQTLGSSKASWTTRILGVNLGGAFGTTADRGILLSLESTGWGRNGDKRVVIGTYRMRGVEIGSLTLASGASDTYALYINGTMGNSTIATDIKGDVYVGGNNHLNASVSITIDGKLRTSGNYRTSAPVTVKDNAYIGGFIEPNAQGDMIFQKNLGVGGGLGNINAPILVNGSFNLYGDRLDGWNSNQGIFVGNQFYVRDMFLPIPAQVSVGGNAFFASGFSNGAKSLSIGNNLEAGGSLPITINGSMAVGQNAAFRGTGSVEVSGKALIGRDASFTASVRQSGSDYLRILGKARFNAGISDINSIRGIEVRDSMALTHPSQGSFDGTVYMWKTLTMNGGLAASFGKGINSAKKWEFDGGGVPRLWSYEHPADMGANLVNNSGTAASGAFPGGPWRTTSLPVLSAITPLVTPMGLTSPAGHNLGYSARDTMISLLDNPPDTIILTGPVLAAMKSFSSVRGPAGVTTNLKSADYNKLYDWFAAQNLLYNGYMVLHIDEAISMTDPSSLFHGKSLLVIDKNITTNQNWPGSADTMNLQVLYVRDGDLGNNFGGPGPFWGYIHYEKPWSGNHAWPSGSQMFGSIYLAGPSSSIIGNGSSLKLERRASVFESIATDLGIIQPHGTISSGSGSQNTRRLVLKEPWVQFELISQVR